jgi:acyl-CoA synthetase (AMP-forming)/AMP-acid ligase II
VTRHLQLADTFEVVADAIPDEPALITNVLEYSYRQLDERANRLAHHLADAGVKPGQHVGVHARNCHEWVEAYHACFKIRAVPINVNYRYRSEELRYLYDNADCVAIIVAPEYLAAVEEVADALPLVRHRLVLGDEYEQALAASSPERGFPDRSEDDLYVLYTGGTTGMPKGVMWRHEDIFMAALNASRGDRPVDTVEQLGKEAAESPFRMRMMALGPMMHGSAQWLAGNAWSSGGACVLYTLDSFDPIEAWRLAERTKANSIGTIGDATARPLAEVLRDPAHGFDLSNVFVIGNGGAPITPAVRELFAEVLPKAMIRDSFGSSETGAAGAGDKVGADSAPRFQVSETTTVLAEDGKPAAVGEVGMLARRGYIPLGYYKDPEKTAKTFPTYDGHRYVIAGDYARREDDGTISLLGRGSVCINSGGEKIYPDEVESAIKRHPAVIDVVVVGTPHERWGEQVTALVQLRPGETATEDDIRSHARTLVADYKVPKAVVVVPEVQHTPVGKTDYSWAKEEAARLVR